MCRVLQLKMAKSERVVLLDKRSHVAQPQLLFDGNLRLNRKATPPLAASAAPTAAAPTATANGAVWSLCGSRGQAV